MSPNFQCFHSLPAICLGGAFASAVLLAACCGCGGGSLGPVEMLERGKYLSDSQRPAEAIALFDDLIELQPENAEAFYLRGLARERTEDFEGALADYTTAIGLNPRYPEAFNNRAVLQAQQGNYEEAITDFTAVLKASPKFALGYKNRGLAYHDTSQFEQALKDFTQAIKLQPDSASYFLRGNLRLEQKQYDDAIADYDLSLKLDDTNSRAWLNRAMALARLGRTADARESLRNASQLDNEIVSKEIVLALRSLSLDPSVGLDVELDDVQKVVKQNGWEASRSEEDHFPFTIKRDNIERKLFVALLDIDQDNITIAADARDVVLDPSVSKSLLIATDSGLRGGNWRFIEIWQPAQKQISTSTLRVAIDSD